MRATLGSIYKSDYNKIYKINRNKTSECQSGMSIYKSNMTSHEYC